MERKGERRCEGKPVKAVSEMKTRNLELGPLFQL